MRHFALLAVLLSLAACSGQASSTTPAASAIVGTPAPNSKFARVRIGMSKAEVQSIIGDPNDQNAHMTGKVFIPLYFGGGTTEIDAHYKGEGILTYASRAVGSTSYELIGIKVDPQERGFVTN